MSASPTVEPGKLGKAKPRDFLIRFAFGAAISVVAGLVSLAFGARAGGLFLAFPAILPATLTLIEQKETKTDAEEDDEGAFLGSIAMVAFAVVAALTLTHLSSIAAVGLASVAWLVCAVGLYAALARTGRWG